MTIISHITYITALLCLLGSPPLYETSYTASCRATAGGQPVQLDQAGVVLSARVDMSVVPGDSAAARRRVRQAKSATRRGVFRPIVRPYSTAGLIIAAVGAVLSLILGFSFIEARRSIIGEVALPMGILFVAVGLFFVVSFFINLNRRNKAKQQTDSAKRRAK